MRNFAQTVAPLHFQPVRPGDEAGGFDRAPKRRGINRRHLFRLQAFAEETRLFPAFIGELHISRPGKTILGRQNRCPMPDQKNARAHGWPR